METIIWIAIFLCLTQSAMFSGLNLAIFSLSRLKLEVEAKKRNQKAVKVLKFRNDSNLALVTILWGNVAVNVLLAMLSDSILTGAVAFVFSTVVITIFAEIIPQAYFSHHALRVASLLSPLLRFYQFILYPVAKPIALILDKWLGPEAIRVFPERDMRRIIQLHMESSESDIARIEGQGALNFLDIDDVPLSEEGEPVDLNSIIKIDFDGNRPLFPDISPFFNDPFLQKLRRSAKTWAIIVDSDEEPRLAMNINEYISNIFFSGQSQIDPMNYCHRPIIVRDASHKLGNYLSRFKVGSDKTGTEIIEYDVILLWNEKPRIITGTDILGRLFRGIG